MFQINDWNFSVHPAMRPRFPSERSELIGDRWQKFEYCSRTSDCNRYQFNCPLKSDSILTEIDKMEKLPKQMTSPRQARSPNLIMII